MCACVPAFICVCVCVLPSCVYVVPSRVCLPSYVCACLHMCARVPALARTWLKGTLLRGKCLAATIPDKSDMTYKGVGNSNEL